MSKSKLIERDDFFVVKCVAGPVSAEYWAKYDANDQRWVVSEFITLPARTFYLDVKTDGWALFSKVNLAEME